MSVRRLLRFSGAGTALALSLVSVRGVAAQSTTSLSPDATVLPKRQLSVRILTGFSRFDALLGNGGSRNIAAGFNSDSVGDQQILDLATTQSAVRTLTGSSAFTVNAGRITAAANSRILTVPLILEYGLTNRLTIGVVVPLVETRTTLGAQFNRTRGTANVGPNPGASNASLNAQLVSSLRGAATALQARLTQCQAAPTGAGCAALLAQQAQAQALITSTAPFASALEKLYGTTTVAGAFFVPLDNSTTQSSINTAINNFRNGYQGFGGTVSSSTPAGAAGIAGFNALDSLLVAAGYDTLQSSDHSSIGDITIGATYQLANTFGDSTATRAYRFSVNGAYRLGTGQPANYNVLYDNATGYGQAGIIVGGAADVELTRRFLASGVVSYTKQLGSVGVSRVPNAENAALPLTTRFNGDYTAGDVLMLSLLPRYRLAGRFYATGSYSMRHIGADSYTLLIPPEVDLNPRFGVPAGMPGFAAATTHAIGFGFTYSSFADRAPGRLPFEASWRHEEVMSASGGPTPKTSLDQLQLRVFFR